MQWGRPQKKTVIWSSDLWIYTAIRWWRRDLLSHRRFAVPLFALFITQNEVVAVLDHDNDRHGKNVPSILLFLPTFYTIQMPSALYCCVVTKVYFPFRYIFLAAQQSEQEQKKKHKAWERNDNTKIVRYSPCTLATNVKMFSHWWFQLMLQAFLHVRRTGGSSIWGLLKRNFLSPELRRHCKCISKYLCVRASSNNDVSSACKSRLIWPA